MLSRNSESTYHSNVSITQYFDFSIFEQVAIYCDTFNNLIPVVFVLGFYVSLVVQRWWDQFNQIPWPDRLALFVTAHIHGQDERGRLMRRTLMRYVCLAYLITMSSISKPVKKRFPTFSQMTEAGKIPENHLQQFLKVKPSFRPGFMLESEQKIIENVNTANVKFNKYFIPLVWGTSIITRARKEGRIKDDMAVKTLIDVSPCPYSSATKDIFVSTGCERVQRETWRTLQLRLD
jgi:hypothetical protein